MLCRYSPATFVANDMMGVRWKPVCAAMAARYRPFGAYSAISFSGRNTEPSCPPILRTIRITRPLHHKTMVYMHILSPSGS
jgi:hypothetical protein